MKMPSPNQWLLDYRAACDVEIIGRDTESSVPPLRVSTPDGSIHYFKACQKDSKELGTNIIRNNSWEVILAYLQLHKAPLIARASRPSLELSSMKMPLPESYSKTFKRPKVWRIT